MMLFSPLLYVCVCYDVIETTSVTIVRYDDAPLPGPRCVVPCHTVYTGRCGEVGRRFVPFVGAEFPHGQLPGGVTGTFSVHGHAGAVGEV